MNKHILQMIGPDSKGLIYKLTGILFRNNCNILKQEEYVSTDGKFFMRTEFIFEGILDQVKILETLHQEIGNSEISFSLNSKEPKKLVLFCTKEHHCISEILVKHNFGELHALISAVISNHEFLRPFVEKFNIPFFYIPAENITREDHEELVFKALERIEFDIMVLAKYMRILTPNFVFKYSNKILNIHHSFLPAFVGANPYKQAFERGVKIIGATAHFVNDHLDEGPIIAQDTKEVDHRFSAIDMAREGRDIEKKVLLKALELVLDDRVFVHENKTIIL